MKYKILLINFIIFGIAVFVFPTARAQEDATAEIEQTLIAEAAVLSDEPEILEGVQIAEPKSMPSSFGLWWRNWHEWVSVAFTLNPVKKAEKRLVFAEERVKLAEYIIQNSADPKVQDKAQQMLAKANEYIQKIEDKKDDLINSADQRVKILLQNIAKHQINKTLVLDKIEDKLPPEKLEQFQQFREKIETQQKNFLQNLQDNPIVSQEVKDKISEVATRIKTQVQERQEFRAEQKDLLDEIKTGNEQARTEFEALRQDRQQQLQQMHQEFREKKDEIINQAKDNNTEAINDLKQLIQEKKQAVQGINQQIKNRVQEIRVELLQKNR